MFEYYQIYWIKIHYFHFTLIGFANQNRTELEFTITELPRDYTFAWKEVFGSSAIDKQSMARRDVFMETIWNSTSENGEVVQTNRIFTISKVHETENGLFVSELFMQSKEDCFSKRKRNPRKSGRVRTCTYVNSNSAWNSGKHHNFPNSVRKTIERFYGNRNFRRLSGGSTVSNVRDT